MHYSICKALGIETSDKWYTHVPKPVYEVGDVTALWNQAVHTDREVTANRPDIIIRNKKEKTCTLIDVAIPADRNVVQKEAEKKLKYKIFSLLHRACCRITQLLYQLMHLCKILHIKTLKLLRYVSVLKP